MAKKYVLALATLALLSTGSAFAQGIQANVGPVSAGVDLGAPAATVAAPVVTTGACGVAPACGTTRTGLLGRLLTPPGGRWIDVSAFGMGVGIGGKSLVNVYGPSALGPNAMIYGNSVASGCNPCGMNTLSYSAVYPRRAASGLCGERVANPWLDLSLFKFGFRVGKVNPAYDMRPAGL